MTNYPTSRLPSELALVAFPYDSIQDVIHFGANKRVASQDHFVHPMAGAYPRLCQLGDGSLLLGYTAFIPDTRVLTIARSIDHGRSFKQLGEVTRCHGDCDNMYLLELPSDATSPPTLLAAFRNHDLDRAGRPVHFRITVCQSHDGGSNWEFLSQAQEKPAPFGLWEPFLRLGKGGEVQLYYSQELAEDDQDTMLVVSADRGKTWSQSQCITGENARVRDGMVGIAETKDGHRDALMMAFETNRHGNFSIEATISYDDGATFSSSHTAYMPVKGRDAGAPQIASFSDGSLALVFMTDEDAETQAWPDNAVLKVIFAAAPRNGNVQWNQAHPVTGSMSFWPGLTRVEDQVLLTFGSIGTIRGRLLTT